jgi:hypothetical protein
MRQFFLGLAVLVSAALGSISESAAQNAFFAVLSGAFVCNTPANANPPLCRQGDVDGVGVATILIIDATTICASVIVDNLDLSNPAYASAAHLHIGQASYTGPIIAQLGAPRSYGGGNPGTSMMCTSAVRADMIAKLRANPEYFYIDVHGQGIPFGALRGQLF